MKKVCFALLATGMLAASCGDKKPQENENTEVLKKEIMTMDSVANAVEDINQEILESVDSLDAMLEEL